MSELTERLWASDAASALTNEAARVLEAQEARIAELEKALGHAIEGFEECSQYKGAYLRDKHGDEDEIAKLYRVRDGEPQTQ